MKKITICEIHSHYFEIVSTFLQIFQQTLEDINNEYKKAIENCLNELNEAANIKSYFEKILDPLLNKKKKASLLEADNLLFSFIPDGINYSKNWIIYFIYSLFTKKETFQSCWVEFIKEFAINFQKKFF